MFITIVILSIFFGLGILGMLVLLVIDIFSKNKWFCEKMHWHHEPYKIKFDGCSQHGICPRCKKEVMQDDQGNWF